MRAFWAIVRRDLRLGLGAQGAALNTLLFFVLAVSLFPLGVGPEPQILARIAAGVIWVAALLAAMLSLDRLFPTEDRKSVVSGKSVSVRVDFGGRRILKKKQNIM